MDINESKACDKKIFGKDKDKVCIYGRYCCVSRLEPCNREAKMIAKAELADIIKVK